ncbi:MAG TPA: AMP-binding protein [Bacillota bacterium]|nr:AMP-binding protein [Bacillota bacterium]
MINQCNEREVQTLVELIQASLNPDSGGITFINNEADIKFLSYQALYENAARLLYTLQMYGLEPGSELVFQIDDNQTMLYYFWACILGGIIPIPVSTGNTPIYGQKLFAVWKSLTNPRLVTSRKHLDRLQEFAAAHHLQETYEKLSTRTIFWEEIKAGPQKGILHPARPSDIAYIQFTSGTTGAPKGVILTHENLVSTIEGIIESAEMTSADHQLSWQPLTHDMGMIGCHLVPLGGLFNQYLMPTALFIRRPSLWIKLASAFQVSIISSSNFGLKYYLISTGSEELNNLDLSKVRIVFDGAEPINEKLCNDFLARLQPCRLKKNVMFTVYGMAEAGLAVTFPPVGQEFVALTIDRSSLALGQSIKKSDSLGSGLAVVDLGYPIPGCLIRICDSQNQALGEGRAGYIQIKGRNVTPGYYHQPYMDQITFTPDGWLNTGDLGFWEQGRLVVIGRSAELIFINGHFYFSHDIERQIEDFEGTEILEAVACGIPDREYQGEDLILFVLFKQSLAEFVPLAAQLQEHLYQRLRIRAGEIIPVKKIPKTTSGKIQRFKLTEDFLNGEYDEPVREIRRLTNRRYNPLDFYQTPEPITIPSIFDLRTSEMV